MRNVDSLSGGSEKEHEGRKMRDNGGERRDRQLEAGHCTWSVELCVSR